MLLERIENIAGKNTVIATGDFNATPDSEPIQIIYNSGLLADSYLVTKEPPYGTEGTFNAFQWDAPMTSRIDYIWVTPDVVVKKYGVLNDMPYGRFPSDHFPIMIKATF
jgi:endonuclease/exonuclease/phosphatase family metal-dependent hydrolase